MLNDYKTEFIVMASRHLLKKAAVNTIRVGDCDVSKCLWCGMWVGGSIIKLLWPYILPKCALVPLSITCTTLDA